MMRGGDRQSARRWPRHPSIMRTAAPPTPDLSTSASAVTELGLPWTAADCRPPPPPLGRGAEPGGIRKTPEELGATRPAELQEGATAPGEVSGRRLWWSKRGRQRGGGASRDEEGSPSLPTKGHPRDPGQSSGPAGQPAAAPSPAPAQPLRPPPEGEGKERRC